MSLAESAVTGNKSDQTVYSFFILSAFLYFVLTIADIEDKTKLIYILILSFAISSSVLFDWINIITAILGSVLGAAIFSIISIASWQHGAVVGLFITLTCQLKQAINRQGYLKNKFMMYLIATAINLFLFFGAYAWRSYF